MTRAEKAKIFGYSFTITTVFIIFAFVLVSTLSSGTLTQKSTNGNNETVPHSAPTPDGNQDAQTYSENTEATNSTDAGASKNPHNINSNKAIPAYSAPDQAISERVKNLTVEEQIEVVKNQISNPTPENVTLEQKMAGLKVTTLHVDPETGKDFQIHTFDPNGETLKVDENVEMLKNSNREIKTVELSTVGFLDAEKGRAEIQKTYPVSALLGSDTLKATLVKKTKLNASEPAQVTPTNVLRDTQHALDKLCTDSRSETNNVDCYANVNEFGSGEGVTVAVLDTGLDYAHPDLQGALIPGYNCQAEVAGCPLYTDSDPSTVLAENHGTAVAGMIAANNDGVGVTGIAPNAKIIPYQVCVSNICWSQDTDAGVAHVVNSNNVDIISTSISGGPSSTKRVLYEALQEQGIHAVSGAGNSGRNYEEGGNEQITYPAGYPGVIGVGSVDKNDEVSFFSSRGSHVDVATYGEDVLVPGVTPPPGVEPMFGCWEPTEGGHEGAYYCRFNGTSFSTPAAAGVLATVLSVPSNAGMTPTEANTLFQQYAIDKGTPGYDIHYGYGVLDILPYYQTYGPGSVQNLTGYATPNSVSFAFEPPVRLNGGGEVTSYQYSLNEGAPWVAFTPQVDPLNPQGYTHTVTGLAQGESYNVSVRALSGNTEGVAQERLPLVTAGVPSAPKDVQVVPDPQSPATVFFSWEPPVSDGGSPVTGYEVSTTTGAVYIVEPDQRMVEFSAPFGQNIGYNVRAQNAEGFGTPADTVYYTSGYRPNSPISVAVSNDAPNQMKLSWGQPELYGSPLVHYFASVKTPEGVIIQTCETVDTYCFFENLETGTAYTFSVRAVTAYSEGPDATTTSQVLGLISAPRNLQVMSPGLNGNLVTLQWSPPSDNGGGVPFQYIILSSGQSACKPIPSYGNEICNIQTLEPYTPYEFTVTAEPTGPQAGWPSSPAATANFTYEPETPNNPPSPPINLTYNWNANGVLLISWTPNANGEPSTSFAAEVAKHPNSGGWVKEQGCETVQYYCTITGLAPNQPYQFKVSASNANGNSGFTEPLYIEPFVPETPPGPPSGKVSNLKIVDAEGGNITFGWETVGGNGEQFTHRIFTNSGDHSCETAATSNTCTVSNIAPGMTYEFYGVLKNDNGEGQQSEPVSVKVNSPETGAVDVGTEGSVFVPINPARVYDSRLTVDGPITKQAATTPRKVNISNEINSEGEMINTSVVPSNATAVAYNITSTGTTTSGFFAVTPGDESTFTSSTINWAGAATSIANGTVVKIDNEKNINIFFGGAGQAHAIVDIVGYFVPPTGTPADSKFNPITPTRVYDSRIMDGKIPGRNGNIPAERTISVKSGINNEGTVDKPNIIPEGATGVAYNLVATGTSGTGWLAVTPGDAQGVSSSSINWSKGGTTIANGQFTKINDNGEIKIFNGSLKETSFVIDIVGYFAPENVAPNGSLFHPITPSRVYDSRYTNSPVRNVEQNGRLVGVDNGFSNNTQTINETNLIPTNAQAVSYSVVATGLTTSGWFAINPGSVTKVSSSTLNWGKDSVAVANGTVVSVDSREIRVATSTPEGAHAIVDIVGYWK